ATRHQFVAQGAREPVGSSLCSYVRRKIWEDLHRSRRQVVDDYAATFHHWQGCACTKKHADEVNVDHLAPHFDGRVLNRRGWLTDTNIIDEDIDAAEAGFHHVENGIHRIWLAHLAEMRHDMPGFRSVQFCRCGVQLLFTASHHDNATAL